MDARKRIAVVTTVAVATVVMYGGLATPKGTENEPVASKVTVTESVHEQPLALQKLTPLITTLELETPKKEEVKTEPKPQKVETVPTKEVKKAEVTPKKDKVEVKIVSVEKKKESVIVPPTHDLIADVMEQYIEDHNEMPVSRTKLLQYIGWADSLSKGTEIDTMWLMAMMWQESRFKNAVESSSGAIGLLQILPSTAETFGVSRSQLSNPKTNIKTSIKYLSYLLDRYDGNLRTATIAYNQGEGNVDRGKARSWYYNSVKEHHDRMARMLEEASKHR